MSLAASAGSALHTITTRRRREARRFSGGGRDFDLGAQSAPHEPLSQPPSDIAPSFFPFVPGPPSPPSFRVHTCIRDSDALSPDSYVVRSYPRVTNVARAIPDPKALSTPLMSSSFLFRCAGRLCAHSRRIIHLAPRHATCHARVFVHKESSFKKNRLRASFPRLRLGRPVMMMS